MFVEVFGYNFTFIRRSSNSDVSLSRNIQFCFWLTKFLFVVKVNVIVLERYYKRKILARNAYLCMLQ